MRSFFFAFLALLLSDPSSCAPPIEEGALEFELLP